MCDAYTGLDMDSFVVTADFEVVPPTEETVLPAEPVAVETPPAEVVTETPPAA